MIAEVRGSDWEVLSTPTRYETETGKLLICWKMKTCADFRNDSRRVSSVLTARRRAVAATVGCGI
jgi:hypothetical protein